MSEPSVVSDSVSPGINDRFLVNLNPVEFLEKFEIEGRSIFDKRNEIVEIVSSYVKPGMTIVDSGTGTGLFLQPFASLVGRHGTLYCQDIGAKFFPFLESRIEKLKSEGVECDMINLMLVGHTDFGGVRVDAIFSADTYHHIEYPAAWLEAAHHTLNKDGVLIVIDFEKIPGQSTDWVLGHVRANKETVMEEIRRGGFELEKELSILYDSYILIWRKK